MKLDLIEPPRSFEVGRRGGRITHVANLELGPDEQVTLTTPSGTELDVVRKDWGYYATPSLNGRLPEHGLHAALVVGVPRDGESEPRAYLLLKEEGRDEEWDAYLAAEEMRVVAWLDSDAAVRGAICLLNSDDSP